MPIKLDKALTLETQQKATKGRKFRRATAKPKIKSKIMFKIKSKRPAESPGGEFGYNRLKTVIIGAKQFQIDFGFSISPQPIQKGLDLLLSAR